MCLGVFPLLLQRKRRARQNISKQNQNDNLSSLNTFPLFSRFPRISIFSGIREFVSPVASEASGPRDQAKESAEEDEEEEKIDLGTFLSKCKEGLAKASATFKADSP